MNKSNPNSEALSTKLQSIATNQNSIKHPEHLLIALILLLSIIFISFNGYSQSKNQSFIRNNKTIIKTESINNNIYKIITK